MNIIYAMI